MDRLTIRHEDEKTGKVWYSANNDTEAGGENSYSYKNAVIDRLGRLEDIFGESLGLILGEREESQ